jgi:DNA (cytosine-5)-methyltransferase 1
MKTITFIDLFCGIGGLRIGFENALKSLGYGSKAVFSSEIKEHARKVYTHNFHIDEIAGDITKINENEIPNFDVMLAGFPCQAFSSAGRRLGFNDTRGTLFFDIARILKKKKPKAFLLENVEGLVSHDNGKTLEVMHNILERLGYKVSLSVLDGKDFGLAQSRKRIYICGLKNKRTVFFEDFSVKESSLSSIIDYNIPAIESDFTRKLLAHFDLDSIVGMQIKDKRGGENNIHSWDFALKGEVSAEQKELLGLLLKNRRNKKWADIIGIDWMDGMPLTVDMISTFYRSENLAKMLNDLANKNYLVFEHPKKKVGNRREYDTSLPKGYNIVTGKLSFEYNKILDPSGVTPTVVATDVIKLGVPVNGGIRPLTIREGLRLFGFPESYDLGFLEKEKAFDLLGNTVCIPVIEEVSKRLIKTAILPTLKETGVQKNETEIFGRAV